MAPGLLCFVLAAMGFLGLLLWFGKVLRLMRERKRMVDSAAGQLEVCREMAANARGDDDAAAILERSRVKPNLCYRVNDDYAVMSMVENGLGVSLLTELMVHRTPYRVAVRPLEPLQFRDIGLAARSFSELPPAAARFVDYVKAWIKEEENKKETP